MILCWDRKKYPFYSYLSTMLKKSNNISFFIFLEYMCLEKLSLKKINYEILVEIRNVSKFC